MNPSEPDPGAAAATDPNRSDARPGSEVRFPASAATDDAVEVLLRVEADEQAAREARDRYRDAPIAPLAVHPPASTDFIGQDEPIYAFRHHAVLNAGRTDVPGYGGALLLTATHLVLDGQVTVTIPLSDITETALGGERLLLSLRNGEGATLDVGQPRLLRAEIAAARGGTAVSRLNDRVTRRADATPTTPVDADAEAVEVQPRGMSVEEAGAIYAVARQAGLDALRVSSAGTNRALAQLGITQQAYEAATRDLELARAEELLATQRLEAVRLRREELNRRAAAIAGQAAAWSRIHEEQPATRGPGRLLRRMFRRR